MILPFEETMKMVREALQDCFNFPLKPLVFDAIFNCTKVGAATLPGILTELKLEAKT